MYGKQYIPTIGEARGLFEIFIPGVFLLLNLAGALFYIESSLWNVSILIELINKNQIMMLLVVIVLGYLAGVVLWLARADWPDQLSVHLRKWASRNLAWLDKLPLSSKFSTSAREAFYQNEEQFPYIISLGSITNEFLPEKARRFYSECWEPRGKKESNQGLETFKAQGTMQDSKTENIKNKYFFIYCKTLINAIDGKSASEIYANEALIRYIAAMFYALFVSLVCWVIVVAVRLLSNFPRTTFVSDSMGSLLQNASACPVLLKGGPDWAEPILFIIFYTLSIIILLWHFRYMRFKEVQTVFTASLINEEAIGFCISDKKQIHSTEIVNSSKKPEPKTEEENLI